MNMIYRATEKSMKKGERSQKKKRKWKKKKKGTLSS